jgi:Glutamine amidotransferases class-II/Glutamate synthase central domain
MFDNVLEVLTLTGRSLPHAMMMMIPEPWTAHQSMSEEKKAFYEYHSCLMEPWDGPAAIAFTDGIRIGAMLDRNGLRPARYYVTKAGLVILASEVGVLDVPPEEILCKGRVQPGRMFLVDTESGRVVDDDELKRAVATQYPYAEWLRNNQLSLEEFPSPPDIPVQNSSTLLQQQHAFGYTSEELKLLITPMGAHGEEAVGSMGTDTPLAVLSERPQLLYMQFAKIWSCQPIPPSGPRRTCSSRHRNVPGKSGFLHQS